MIHEVDEYNAVSSFDDIFDLLLTLLICMFVVTQPLHHEKNVTIPILREVQTYLITWFDHGGATHVSMF